MTVGLDRVAENSFEYGAAGTELTCKLAIIGLGVFAGAAAK